jgi:ubiquinone/menaquinone biosynthesis C-methylase UbiE
MHDTMTTEHTEGQRERVRSFFDASKSWQGDFYTEGDGYFARLLRRRRELATGLLHTIERPVQGTALDVGCGSGVYMERLQSLGYEVTGIDLSGEMIEACTKRFRTATAATPPVHLQTADVEHLPFPDKHFDLVLCIGVLGYLLEDERALKELSRVLKPGGHLLVNVTNAYALSDLDTRLRRQITSVFTRGRKAGPEPERLPYAIRSEWMMKHRNYSNKSYRLGRFEALLGQHGFTQKSALTFGFEFRIVRRLHLLPETALDGLELFLERIGRKWRIPYLSRSGWGYLGLFSR